jgi:eukaryotic-like serine/threonine-protein kinase
MISSQQLGRYQIESHLGSGAYADVYKALDTALDRVVALKVLKPALMADEDAFSRFLQEAKTLANLMHPHIAWVWDLGEADGRYFLAMRYVDGPSLDKYLAQNGKLSWDDSYRITQEIAAALQMAHDKGIVHRDVKPQNILISATEGAVLTDFGLVKAMESSGMSTRTGAIIGTPQYIPPEVWQGETGGPPADLYALACVIVEMLTGQVVFEAPTPPAVMLKHFQPLELPEKWPAEIPNQFVEMVQTALQQDPGSRQESVKTFVFQIDSAIAQKEAQSLQAEQQARQEAEEKSRQAELDRVAREAAEKARQETEERLRLEQEKNNLTSKDEHTYQAQEENVSKEVPEILIKPSNQENPAGIAWVEIPAGEFMFGKEKQKRKLENPFLIGKYPVTNHQYKKFIDGNSKYPVPEHWDEENRCYPVGKDNHPVVYVSWYDVEKFCEWAKCGLPSEEEWEKAARCSDGRIFPWGNEWIDGMYCNSYESGINDTTPVDKFSGGKSPYGVWDMSGNVWEWTSTLKFGTGIFQNNLIRVSHNPIMGITSGNNAVEFVQKGGAYYNLNGGVRASFKLGNPGTLRNKYHGFRVARDTKK